MRTLYYCFLAPVIAVWLIGAAIAISRWSRHPRVSALLVLGMCGMFLSSLVLQIGVPAIMQQLRSQSAPGDRLQLFVSLFIIGASPLRIFGWGCVLVAIFSGREYSDQPSPARKPLQFSILGLLIITAVVGAVCGFVRLLIDFLGESSMYLLSLIDDIPIVICWLGGGWLAISRWRAHPQVCRRALSGLCLTAASFLALQATWLLVIVTQSAYSFLGLVNGLSMVTMPVAWTLLIAAALGGRHASAAQPAPPSEAPQARPDTLR